MGCFVQRQKESFTSKVSQASERVRAMGTEARSWVAIPGVLLAVLWPPAGRVSLSFLICKKAHHRLRPWWCEDDMSSFRSIQHWAHSLAQREPLGSYYWEVRSKSN